MFWIKKHSVTLLSITLYLFIFWLRYDQGGWDINLDLFPGFRQNLDQRIATLLPSPQAELLSGILLGNKKDLPAKFRLALRDSSTLHIVVVSGENLTLVAALFMNLSGLLKRKAAILLSLGLVIFYTILTGAQVPVLRAAIMAILAFSAQFFQREKDGLWILMLTGGLMLLLYPKWLGDLSFQLSFMATLGVIVIAPILEHRLKFLPAVVKTDLAVTLGAQLLVIPIIAQNFHQLSLVGIITNMLIGWTIPIIMILGSIMIVFGSVFVIATNVFLTYFIYIVEFFSSLPFAWEYVGEQVWIVWLGYYLLLGGILLGISKFKSQNSNLHLKS